MSTGLESVYQSLGPCSNFVALAEDELLVDTLISYSGAKSLSEYRYIRVVSPTVIVDGSNPYDEAQLDVTKAKSSINFIIRLSVFITLSSIYFFHNTLLF